MPHLLFVCAANRARSVLAALQARQQLDAHGARDVTVASAGLEAVAGEPVWPPAMLVARGAGLDPSGHRARPLTADLVAGSDLVLTATAAQRDLVRARFADLPGVAGPSSRVLTWRELEWVLGCVSPQWGDVPLGSRPARVPDFVAHYRVGLPTPPAAELDTADPADRGPEVLATSARQTHDAVKLLVEALCLETGAPQHLRCEGAGRGRWRVPRPHDGTPTTSGRLPSPGAMSKDTVKNRKK